MKLIWKLLLSSQVLLTIEWTELFRNISYAISTYCIIVIDGTVWNIINHAAEEAHQEDDAVAGNDVQQIIYIAYDDNDIENKETSVHIVNQTTMVSNTPRLMV